MKLARAAVLLPLLLAGCSLGPRPQPKYFLLNPGKPVSMESMRTDATLAVNFVDVGAPFASDGFTYQVSDDRWEIDPYNQFLVSPAEMMTGILRNWIHQSRLYRNVAIPTDGGGQTFVLDCDLTELYADFRKGASPTAELTMEVQVFHRTREGKELVLRKTYSQSISFEDRTPQALVSAWSEGLSLNLAELLGDLAEKAR